MRDLMVAKTTTADLLYERLEAMIADGKFRDGERLDEVSLAREFGVSRTPLRQALQLLSSAGLAVVHPNRGTFVRAPDFVRLVEMFEVMAELEAWCANLPRNGSPRRRSFYCGRLHCAASVRSPLATSGNITTRTRRFTTSSTRPAATAFWLTRHAICSAG